MTSPARARRWPRRVAIGAVTVAVLAVGGASVLTSLGGGGAPARRTTAGPESTRSGRPAAGVPADGTWTAAGGSFVGYRVRRVLFGQDGEAVGRTSAVTGQMTFRGTRITDGSFTVDLTSAQSNQERRAAQFLARIVDTATYPRATFALTAPVDLGSRPAEGTALSAKASGALTVNGTTRPVTAELAATRSGGTIRVHGSIPVTFADWNIAIPSLGNVTVEDHGLVEFLLVLTPA